MADQCVEMSDVVIVLHEDKGHMLDELLARLKEAGAEIAEVDAGNLVVEATLETAKAKALNKLDFVKYVRPVFNWTADLSGKQSKDKDSNETDDETEDE
jgi:predicted neutral ceramidase superfamily lipid hydrolase